MFSSLSFSVEACLLLAIWAVKLLFPPVDSVAAVFSPSLSRLWWLVFVFCFAFLFFLFVSRRKVEIKWSSLGLFFICFHRLFGARSSQPRYFSQDTRPSAEFPTVVRSCRRKRGSCRSSESGVWSARARELFVLWRV